MNDDQVMRIAENAITIERRKKMERLEEEWAKLTRENAKATWVDGQPVLEFPGWQVRYQYGEMAIYRACEACGTLNYGPAGNTSRQRSMRDVADVKKNFDTITCNRTRKCRKKYNTYKPAKRGRSEYY